MKKYIQIMNEQILNNPKETLAKSYLAIIQRNAGKLKLAKKNAQEAKQKLIQIVKSLNSF